MGFKHLKENFVVTYHAQFAAGALFDSPKALFEISHFGIERRITRAQPFVGLLLGDDLSIDIPDAHPAALAQPQAVLKGHGKPDQNQGEYASSHRQIGSGSVPVELIKGTTTGVGRCIAEILFDAQQLIVLGQTI